MGYEALEKDITIAKLPEKLTPSRTNSVNDSITETVPVLPKEDSIDDVDMSDLKTDSQQRGRTSRYMRHFSHPASSYSTSNHSLSHRRSDNYTIYEETSDLSGSESHGSLSDTVSQGKTPPSSVSPFLSFFSIARRSSSTVIAHHLSLAKLYFMIIYSYTRG